MATSKQAMICSSCKIANARVTIRHRDGSYSLHCKQVCAESGGNNGWIMGDAIAPVTSAKERLVVRLSNVAPTGTPDGTVITLPKGVTLFHGIADGTYPWTELREFSYVSNNVNPSIGAGIGEKLMEYPRNVFCARLFELELRKTSRLILNNSGGTGVKIESIADLDADYGTANDGYIGSEGEEEIRMRRAPRKEFRLVRSYFFATPAVTAFADDVAMSNLTGGNDQNGEVLFGRWTAPRVLGFVIETLPFVDRLFSYYLLRQIEAGKYSFVPGSAALKEHPLYMDSLMIGVYHLIRHGLGTKTYVAFEENKEQEVSVLAQSKLKCHEHPNASRKVSSFLVTSTATRAWGSTVWIFGGGIVNANGDESFPIIANQLRVQFVELYLESEKAKTKVVEFLVPYSILGWFVGPIVDQDTNRSFVIDVDKVRRASIDKRGFYIPLLVAPRTSPSHVADYLPSMNDDLLLRLYPDSVAHDVIRQRADSSIVAMLLHAVQVRSEKLVLHAVKFSNTLFLAGDDRRFGDALAAAFTDMALWPNTHPFPSDADWLISQALTHQLEREPDLVPKLKVSSIISLVNSLAAQFINAPIPESKLHAELLVMRYEAIVQIFFGPTKTPLMVASALVAEVEDWEAFKAGPYWKVWTQVASTLMTDDRATPTDDIVALARIKSVEPRGTPWAPVPWTWHSLLLHKSGGTGKVILDAMPSTNRLLRLIRDPHISHVVFDDYLDYVVSNPGSDPNPGYLLSTLPRQADTAKITTAIKKLRLWRGWVGHRADSGDIDNSGKVNQAYRRYQPNVEELLFALTPEANVIEWVLSDKMTEAEAARILYRRVKTPVPKERHVDGPVALSLMSRNPQLFVLLTPIHTYASEADRMAAPPGSYMYDKELVRILNAIGDTARERDRRAQQPDQVMTLAPSPKKRQAEDGDLSSTESVPGTPADASSEESSGSDSDSSAD